MAQPPIFRSLNLWSITSPFVNQSLVASVIGGFNHIRVLVDDAGDDNDRYVVNIVDFGSGSVGSTAQVELTEGPSGIWFGDVPCGGVANVAQPTATSHNKTVFVTAHAGAAQQTKSNPFWAWSGAHTLKGLPLVRAGGPCRHCQAGKPIPVAVNLVLDSPIADGDCSRCHEIPLQTRLLYVNDPSFECLWLSEPIDLCSDPRRPAYWMFSRSDDVTWVLVLKRGKKEVVKYGRRTHHCDCSLPVRLHLNDEPGEECKDWHRHVEIHPA